MVTLKYEAFLEVESLHLLLPHYSVLCNNSQQAHGHALLSGNPSNGKGLLRFLPRDCRSSTQSWT